VTIRGDRYREAPEFVKSLDRVLDLEPELLLPGHHEPVSGKALIRDELLRLRGAVEFVHEKTLAGMNAGKDVRTLMREIELPPELEVGQGYGKVSWSVRAIWESYAGWFHHESTCELYAVPPSATHGDLVELCGGPDSLVERALSKIDAGRFVEAIQLVEIVLSGDPDHAAGLEAMIVAHRGLEQPSVNFWETSWLRKQIADCQARLR
jgi:alkyl sulfatase BDS1-like metallo-beta-lactamase superfamily hydrolase